MPFRSPVMSILLLTADPDLQAQFKQDLQEIRESQITLAKDWDSASRTISKRSFDVVILETNGDGLQDLREAHHAIDPSRTFILADSRAALRRASGVIANMGHHNGKASSRVNHECGLEDYMESKLGDFVKGMKNGSARNLHPMLIKAVERPLITMVLKETNGNQIQAAQLLGVNRNTLRKKITEFRIPVKREKSRRIKPTA